MGKRDSDSPFSRSFLTTFPSPNFDPGTVAAVVADVAENNSIEIQVEIGRQKLFAFTRFLFREMNLKERDI